ncbi:MAG: hypothetical protein WCO12_03425 [bacterium]
MIKVCLLVGEGDSERYFFPSFLEGFGFSDLSQKTTPSTFLKKDDIYWFFPFPPGLDKCKSGKKKLKTVDTYQLAHHMLINGLKPLTNGERIEIYLIVPFDTDGGDAGLRKKEIEEVISQSNVSVHKKFVNEIEVEIESWYFAGLTEKFPFFQDCNNAELVKLVNSKTDKYKHTKEDFKKFVDLDEVRGSSDLAKKAATHFDIEKACKHSRSFNDFYSNLVKEGLL